MLQITKKSKIEYKGFVSKAIDKIFKPRPYYRNPYKVIRPSQITNCKRWIVGDILELSKPFTPTPKQQKCMDNGTYVHKRYLKNYILKTNLCSNLFDEKSGMVKPFIDIIVRTPEYWLKGAADSVVINWEEGFLYVLELKSMNSFEFNQLYSPKPDHIAQAYLYMFMLDIPRASILYECKDNQDPKEFLITQFDQDYLESLLERIRSIQKSVKDNKLPDCETGNKKCMCKSLNTQEVSCG